MTGYDEAATWLKANAPEWVISHGETELRASAFAGGPTEEHVTVELVDSDARLKQSLGSGYVTLTGVGRTYLDAVQRAVGGLTAR